MKTCQLCGQQAVETLIDFGPQPICNRFPKVVTDPEATFPMVLEQCRACGLVQTTQPVPAEELRPRVDWITYTEPEGHLDTVADKLARLPGLTGSATFAGISFKDDSLLRRMRKRGFTSTWRLDPQADLGVTEQGTGVETLQKRLTPESARRIAANRGRVDVLLVRHIFEHAHRPLQFAAALKELTKPDGYVVIEIPEAEKALDLCDYSMLWEEHVLYFTPVTFRQCFAQCGFSLVSYECFPYTLENCLLGVARIDPNPAREAARADRELQRADRFAAGLAGQRQQFRQFLTQHRKTQGPVAIFGAGHLAATFINLLGLKKHIDFVADDNPNKRGLFMPGSKLPILGSASLVERDVKLCLLTVAVESEEKVIQKNQAFVRTGGAFASIFPASRHALKT
ncbi:MAG TPA: class I SAM-dependent methyltransferase [Verrucomicrobiae bacterium]|nr:class I SAM-dependent methyltransferase [Verrucomicrobiae bacterium]